VADNITLNAGSGGAVVATDDDGTAHHQYVKLEFGGDDTQTKVTASVGLPVQLLAGSAAIGKLAANSGVDIGDIDVTSVIPGTGASNLGKAEDAVHASGDVGVMALVVRQDSQTNLGADGDYVPLTVGANGGLRVAIVGSIAPGTGAANPLKAEDDPHTSGDAGSFVLAVRRDTPSVGASADGDYSSLNVDSSGRLYTHDPQIVAAVKTGDATGSESDNGIALLALRDDEVGSTAVTTADGDYTHLRTDRFGALKTTQLADATSEIKYAAIDAASSGDNTLVSAAGAGVKIRVLSLFLIGAGDVNVRFESGAGGTALTGQMNLTTNSGFCLPFNPGGWFETADNTLLNLELSGAVSVDGCLSYVLV
jgi:hypothetical protein